MASKPRTHPLPPLVMLSARVETFGWGRVRGRRYTLRSAWALWYVLLILNACTVCLLVKDHKHHFMHKSGGS